MTECLLFPQSGQLLFCIFNLREAGVGVFPEGKEFFVVFYGFSRPSLPFIQLGQPVIIFGKANPL
jgi:hypothetical membrane protein